MGGMIIIAPETADVTHAPGRRSGTICGTDAMSFRWTNDPTRVTCADCVRARAALGGLMAAVQHQNGEIFREWHSGVSILEIADERDMDPRYVEDLVRTEMQRQESAKRSDSALNKKKPKKKGRKK